MAGYSVRNRGPLASFLLVYLRPSLLRAITKVISPRAAAHE